MNHNPAADPGPAPVRAGAASRLRLLTIMRETPTGCGIQNLAERTGLHPNTVRFHLDRLEEEGLVSKQVLRRSEPGRPPLAYTATPKPDAHHEHREFDVLAKVLVSAMAQNIDGPVDAAIEAGRSWGLTRSGHQLAAVDDTGSAEPIAVLVQTLEEMGFAPQLSVQKGHTLVLQRHCPYLEVAETHQEVVCSIHLGLIRGVLERLQAPMIAESLVPFASPQGCEAHLSSNPRPR